MASALDVPITDVDIAAAYSEEAAVSIVAFRFAGVPTEELIPARQSLDDTRDMQATPLTVGGKEVVRYKDPAFGLDGYEEWQYAHDGVLYVVRAKPIEGVPPILEAAFAAGPESSRRCACYAPVPPGASSSGALVRDALGRVPDPRRDVRRERRPDEEPVDKVGLISDLPQNHVGPGEERLGALTRSEGARMQVERAA
jgi:hypothetical protein